MGSIANNGDLAILANLNDTNKIPQYKQTIQVNFYHYYIIKEIGEPDEFLDLINTLKTAEEHDTVFIYLNTPGGQLSTTVQIISAIRQCKGNVVTCIEGEVCSAGTMIFLAGHKYIVNPNCTFMIHNYSGWAGGKGNEVSRRVNYMEKYFKKLAHDIYSDFLTEEEIENVLEGRDFWMESDEIIARLGEEDSSQDSKDIAAEIIEGTVEGNVDQPIIEPKKSKKSKTA